jgi:hypothetical protein
MKDSTEYTYVFDVAFTAVLHAKDIELAKEELWDTLHEVDEVVYTPGYITKLVTIMDDAGMLVFEDRDLFIPFGEVDGHKSKN